MLLYLASSYTNAAWIESFVRPRVELAGCVIVSTWHDLPHAPEDLESLSDDERHRIAAQNDRDLSRAQAALVIADERSGETFVEAGRAWQAGTPIVWTGRAILTAYRPGVVRCATLGEAFNVLDEMVRRRSVLPGVSP